MTQKMTLDQQTKILEKLLQKPDNKQCAECYSRIPRWASITFGVFFCIRCSGVHRQLGTHITKVKSVNLDKWPDPKIEMFQHMSNALVNSYWEKNLPDNFKKPGQQASNHEITDFLTNKYVHKKWANNDDWSNDPAWLFENKPKKFQKYVKYFQENFCASEAKKGDKMRPADSDSSDGETIQKRSYAKQSSKVGLNKPVKAARVAQVAAPTNTTVPDLLNMDPTPVATSAPSNGLDGIFGPSTGQDDGFDDFVAGGSNNQNQMTVNMQNTANTQAASNGQQTINIQNLYQMYQANPHSANDKFSALDNVQIPGQAAGGNAMGAMGAANSIGGMGANQMGSNAVGGASNFNQGQNQQFQPMAGQGFGGMGAQQQQQPMGQMGNFQQPQPQFAGSQQNNQFGGFQQSQQPSYGSQQQQFGGFQQAAPQQQFGGFQQNTQSQNNQFGGFQSASTPQQPPKVFNNGLVDLTNLGNKGQTDTLQAASFIPGPSTIQPMGQNQFGGNQNSGFGNFNQQNQNANTVNNGQKKDAFGGLCNF